MLNYVIETQLNRLRNAYHFDINHLIEKGWVLK